VPDAVKALWQDVDEEPANELARLEGHGFVSVRAFDTVVLVFKRDTAGVGRDQAAVGDGDAMGVAGQVGKDLLWPPALALRTDAWHRRTSPSSIAVTFTGRGSNPLDRNERVGIEIERAPL